MVSSKSSAAADIAGRNAVDHNQGAGRMVHEWLALECQKAEYQFAAAMEDTGIVGVVRSTVAEAPEDRLIARSYVLAIGSGTVEVP